VVLRCERAVQKSGPLPHIYLLPEDGRGYSAIDQPSLSHGILGSNNAALMVIRSVSSRSSVPIFPHASPTYDLSEEHAFGSGCRVLG